MDKEKERILNILKTLKNTYPDPKTELVHKNEFEMFVAVVLSAQTTDKKVNQVTPKLFEKYKTWEDLANADLTQLQKDIHGVNFHLGKAERLIKAAQMVLAEYGGVLPKTMVELVKVPSVARKSANVLMQELWDITEGIVVDTHVSRLSDRLGLSKNTDPVKIEKDLIAIVPKEYWRNISGSLVLHGRYVCKAKKPDCASCVLKNFCPSAFRV